jgi:cation:H+ antiporter
MYLELFAGLTYLLVAGDLLVRGAISLAERAEVPPLVVGLTIVAFGTSAPELFVCVSAALRGFPDVAIANVVGSNVANVLLVLGVPAIFNATPCPRALRGDLLLLMAVSVLFAGLCWLGPLGRREGLLLLAGVVGVLMRSARQAGRSEDVQAAAAEELERVLGLPRSLGMIVLFIVLGCLGLPLGAHLMVQGAVLLAERFAVPQAVVGVSIVALGTSLPELATTVLAAIHRNADIAVGNIVGSNLFNMLGIMGVTALVAPQAIALPPGFAVFDLPVMLAAAGALVTLAWFRGRIGPASGAVLGIAYLAYVVLMYAGVGT